MVGGPFVTEVVILPKWQLLPLGGRLQNFRNALVHLFAQRLSPDQEGPAFTRRISVLYPSQSRVTNMTHRLLRQAGMKGLGRGLIGRLG